MISRQKNTKNRIRPDRKGFTKKIYLVEDADLLLDLSLCATMYLRLTKNVSVILYARKCQKCHMAENRKKTTANAAAHDINYSI